MDRRSFLLASTGALALAGCVERGRNPAGANRSTTQGQNPVESTTARPLTRTARSDGPTSTRGTDEWTDAATSRTTTATSTPNERTDEAVQRRVSIGETDDIERRYDLRIEVEVLEETITTSRTTRLRVTTTNEGSRRRLSIGEDGCGLFNRDGGASESPGLYLHSPGSTKWIDRPGDRWTDGTDPDVPRAWAAYGCLSSIYAEDESITNEYVLWDDYRVEGYLVPGTYRFEESVRVMEYNGSTTNTPDREPLAEFDWGFDLSVALPENE